MKMEQTTVSSVPCVFTTQDPSSQVIVTQVPLPQEQLQPAVSSYQALTSVQGAVLEARVQDGVGSIPAVQTAIYQTEGSTEASGQSVQGQAQFQAQLPTSYFSTTSIEGVVESNSSTSISPSTYDDVLKKLSQLFSSELNQMYNITDDHWKVQEFPLARIKKIMRMDEDVRMISAEVPVMLSKALEMFITELSLRAWLQTEESKRRTVQRSDIAMAITKNDMFDFLIDIVPREEIQLRSKTQKSTEGGGAGGGGGGESLQLLPPELLQLCIQQLAQQALSASTEGEEESGISEGEDSNTTVGLLQQQLQLLQQLMQIQQLQQEQQLDQTSPGLGQTIQLQHPPILDQPQATNTPTQQSTSVGAPTLDTEVLYSSVSGITTAGAAGGTAGGGAAGAIQFSTALEQLTGTGTGNQTILSIQPEQHSITQDQSSSVGTTSFAVSGQQTLHHVDPNSIAFHHTTHELLQQPGSQSATVIIQPPPMMDESSTSSQVGTTVTTLLDSQGRFPHHQRLQHIQLDQSQRQGLVTTSDTQQASNRMVHHVLVDPATVDHTGSGHFQLTGSGSGGGSGGGEVGQSVAMTMAGGVEFANDGSLTLHDGLPSTTVTYSS